MATMVSLMLCLVLMVLLPARVSPSRSRLLREGPSSIIDLLGSQRRVSRPKLKCIMLRGGGVDEEDLRDMDKAAGPVSPTLAAMIQENRKKRKFSAVQQQKLSGIAKQPRATIPPDAPAFSNETLGSLRAVLPAGIDDTKLTELLRRARGDVELAANIYLDMHPQTLHPPPPPAPLFPLSPPMSRFPTNAPRSATASKRNGNAEVGLNPDWRMYLGTLLLSSYTTKSADHNLIKAGSPIRLVRPPKPKSVAKGAAPPPNNVVRLAFVEEELAHLGECARLPSSTCTVIGPLMDLGAIEVQGQVVIPPGRTAAAVEIQISVSVTLTPASLDLKGPNRSLIPRLIEMLGVHPAISCMTENDPKPSPAVLQDLVPMNVTGETPGDSFRSSLRGYQSMGLGWMLEREKQESGGGAGVRGGLHALWAEYRFDGGGVLYVKDGADGEATVTRPCASPSPRGGILADEMGLGKTVQLLALLSRDPCGAGGEIGPWDDHEGVGKGVGGTLVICPMSILPQWISEASRHFGGEKGIGHKLASAYYGSDRGLPSKGSRGLVVTTYGVVASDYERGGKKEAGLLYSVRWRRIVLDEAHAIKQHSSLTAQAIFALDAERRWALTGTPVQNALSDIYSLIRFLRLDPYCDHAFWAKHMGNGDAASMSMLRGVLAPLLLRRTKDELQGEEVAGGRGSLDLPPRRCETLLLNLTVEERDVYRALLQRSRTKFGEYVQEGRVLNNYASILEMLLRLRQCCAHPFLVLSRGDTGGGDFDTLAQKLAPGGGAMDKFVAGASPREAPSGETGYVASLIENLKKGGIEELGDCPVCLETVTDAVITPCGHVFCRECILGATRASSAQSCPTCRAPVSRKDITTLPRQSRFEVDVQGGWRPSTKVSALVSELTALGAKGREAEERAEWQLLPGKRPKSVVFSQWTAMLDLLEVALGKEGIPSVRLDGSLSMQQRTSILSDFSASSAQGVLLMSLKAGGQGLNLCFCQNVFLVDPWWNPHMEEQAIARVHRIGQMHNVTVKRLIVRDTVEERIIEMQDRKMGLSEGALGGAGLGEKKTADERIKELQRLFEDDADTSTMQSNGILAAAAAPQESGGVPIGV